MEATYINFVRQERDLPKLVMLQDNDSALRGGYPALVTAVLPYKASPNGLPHGGEFSRVSKLEDRLSSVVQRLGAVHMGHVTYDGRMLVIFRAPRALPSKVKVRVGFLNDESIDLVSVQDESWNRYDSEYGPDAVELEWARNQQLLHVLSEHGDVHSRSRVVDFTFKFNSPESRASFIVTGEADYKIAAPTNSWEPEGTHDEFWCELRIDTPIEPDMIASLCAELRGKAEAHGGEFDGWACPVIS